MVFWQGSINLGLMISVASPPTLNVLDIAAAPFASRRIPAIDACWLDVPLFGWTAISRVQLVAFWPSARVGDDIRCVEDWLPFAFPSGQGCDAMRKALKVRRTGVPAFLLVRRMPTGGIGRIFSTILLA